MAPPTKTGQAKLDDVTALLRKLTVDLDDRKLKSSDRDSTLEQLKVYGRSPENSGPIFTKEGISTLARYAFDSTSVTTSREALRCLANALLLKESTRQMLVDCQGAPKAAEKLKLDNSDDEFLLSRILFLLSYGTNVDYQSLIKANKLADSICDCTTRHAKRYAGRGLRRFTITSPMDDMALTETCKLIFNITHFHTGLSPSFSKSIPSLVQILVKTKIAWPPLEQPLSSVINALLNLDLAESTGHSFSKSALFPKSDPRGPSEQLINVLDAAVLYYKIAELDQAVAPVLTLIRKILDFAPESVKSYMRSRFLPTDAERDQPLGKSETLPSRLLRLSTSATTPALRTSISALMFELSDSDPSAFVKNVGYGFAAGFLMSQNLPMPEGLIDPSHHGSGGNSPAINPITGQRLDAESVTGGDDEAPMTEEEKEREAEKLFVLFERLRKTGVVDVVNPVKQALDEGRFEELPDDA